MKYSLKITTQKGVAFRNVAAESLGEAIIIMSEKLKESGKDFTSIEQSDPKYKVCDCGANATCRRKNERGQPQPWQCKQCYEKEKA